MSGSRSALCIAVATAFVAVLFVPAPASAGPGGLYGGTVVVATTYALDTSPLNLSPQNEPLHSLLYDSLGRASATDLVPAPWLATGWAVNLTANTVTFHLRGNARWADGTPLGSSAVVASYQRYLNAGLLSGFTVAAPDSLTAVFTFTRGGGDFLGKWVTLPIAYPDLTSSAKASGLFDVDAAVPGVSLQIKANPNHWRGRPYPDAILYQFHTGPTGLDDAACDMVAKRIDFLAVPLLPTDLTEDRPCGRLQEAGNASLSHIFAATDPGFSFLQLGINTQVAPLDDPAFRVAVTSALDRVLIAQIEPSTVIADSVVTSANAYWFNASVPQYRVVKGVVGGQVVTILDNVNDMLDRAGYFDRNGDGWRETPAGAPFNLTFLHLNATADPRIAKVFGILTNLRTVGIHVIDAEASPATIAQKAASGQFQMYMGTTGVEADPSALFDLYHSSRIGTGRNYNRVSDPALDGLLAGVRDDIDIAARQEAARDAQGYIADEALAMPLVHYNTIFVYNRLRFEGWVSEPGGINNFWSFAGLHVVQKGPLSATIVPFTNSITAGRSTSVIVIVRDSADNAVEAADVALTGGTLSPANGVTDANGRFVATFSTPASLPTQDFTVQAVVTKPGYDADTATTSITVHAVVQRLDVSILRSASVLDPGMTSAITVSVRNQTGGLVEGATVVLDLTPGGAGGTLSATTGTTAANGTFRAVLTSTAGPDTTYHITATVSLAGYEAASASTSVLAKGRGGAPPSTPALDTITMVVVVAAAAFVFARWQARRRKP